MFNGVVRVRDTDFFVYDTGEKDRPVIVCLHSLFLDSRMFDDLVEASEGRYRFIRPDFRGQGRTAKTEEASIDMETCAADIEAIVDHLEVGSANWLVQSMGGDVGFRVAANRPDLVNSMVALGTSACAEPPDQLEAFRQWVEDVGQHGFVGEILETTMQIMFGETTRNNPEQQEMLKLWRDRIAAVPPTLKPAMAGVVERGSVVDRLAEITAPVLVISGNEDLPRPPAWADEVVDRLPNAELVRLQGIGHSPILEDPETAHRLILGFVDQHAQGR
jgi:3-oxoadipate enol-lactonase